MAFLTKHDLESIGFASVGENVLVSEFANFYGAERISIGDNVRIDDFCVISAGEGGVHIGSYIHIAVYCSVIGAGRVTLKDYCNISSRVAVYSSNDDYSGKSMTNPMVPQQYCDVSVADVVIGKHVIIGSGSVVLPGVRIEEGCAIGALSLVDRDCGEFGVYVGCPVKRVRGRDRGLLEKEIRLLRDVQLRSRSQDGR